MLYEKINMLADSLEAAVERLAQQNDSDIGIVMAYAVIADVLRRDLEAESSLFVDIAEFTDALGGLAQVEPNVGARTAYTLVAGRLESILREHA